LFEYDYDDFWTKPKYKIIYRNRTIIDWKYTWIRASGTSSLWESCSRSWISGYGFFSKTWSSIKTCSFENIVRWRRRRPIGGAKIKDNKIH
jgi:hypothetical protein